MPCVHPRVASINSADMALVPFSYANPFTDQLKLKERLFTIDGRLLRIKQAWKEGGKGGTDVGFGASVYPAAYVLAEHLERHPHLVRGMRVIELGTGTGFLGIAAGVLGAFEVCLTDGDDESLRLTRDNVEANTPQGFRKSGRYRHPATATDDGPLPLAVVERNAGGGDQGSPPPAMTVRKLRWGCVDDMAALRLDNPRWDVVLGSDIAALPYESSFRDLLRTIVTLVGGRAGVAPESPPLISPSAAPISLACPERTSISSVRAQETQNRSDGEGVKSPPPLPLPDDAANEKCLHEDDPKKGRGRREVLVLLAHKRRHVSEEAFFEALKNELGEKSCLPTRADDVHPDFRGEGIVIHKYQLFV